MLEQRTFTHGDTELRYYVGPDNGPPLVLLHGVTGRSIDFCTMLRF